MSRRALPCGIALAALCSWPLAAAAVQPVDAVSQAAVTWLQTHRALPGTRMVLEAAPDVAGFELLRREWVFWRWQPDRARLNHYVRLFDRTRAAMSGHEVHESVRVDGPVRRLDAIIDHYGERDIGGRVDKANRYSSLQVRDRLTRQPRLLRLRMVVYPSIAFVRYYVWRGHWRGGWAGFVAARVHAFYAFLKYAKLYERRMSGSQRHGHGAFETERRDD